MEQNKRGDLIRPGTDHPVIIDDPDVVRHGVDLPRPVTRRERKAAGKAVEQAPISPTSAVELSAGAGKDTAELRYSAGKMSDGGEKSL